MTTIELKGFVGLIIGIGPVLLEPDLVERDAGEWSGLTRAEIEAGWPGYLASGARPASYEADEPLVERVLTAIDRIVEQVGEGDVLVVTHGGVIYALEQHLGVPHQRKPNLGARWFSVDRTGALGIGEALVLVDHDALSVPDLL